MARILILTFALTILGGCSFPQRQLVAIAPELWLVEALDAQGASVDAVRVCADTRVREGFTRPLPAVGKTLCVREHESRRLVANGYVERCQLNDVRYSLHVAVDGDPARDFTVRFAMQPLNSEAAEGPRQALRYRHVGACPEGWKIGDTDKPGRGMRPNVLS